VDDIYRARCGATGKLVCFVLVLFYNENRSIPGIKMPPTDLSPLESPARARNRARVVHELRRLLPRIESGVAGERILSFGLPALDSYLSHGGLPFGALHEITPQRDGDIPACFGFIAAMLGRVPPGDPVIFIFTQNLTGHSRLYGHGLMALGLDPGRVLLVETQDDRQALWAIEEALRSGVPAAVVGMIGTSIDLKSAQRLNLAAGDSGRLLFLVQPARLASLNVAMTRWRIGAETTAKDRFGLIAHWRWRLSLERCRNGRTGEWRVEFDHAAHCFSLAPPLAHCSLPHRPGAQDVAQAG
jgi:protein ImuA